MCPASDDCILSLWCTGSNTDGQLGSSPSVESDTFREAITLTAAAASSVGGGGSSGRVKAVAAAGGGRSSVAVFEV
jgi:hypothetical protein